MVLYKYRDFNNLEFALDIFINQRLFAANFKDLNDPMEGRFVYTKGLFRPGDLMEIRGSKARYNILSLGHVPNNMLMWSYYAGGHTGFVVGVEIDDNNTEIEEVQYVEELRLEGHEGNLPKHILSRKLKLWGHEQECRVFKQHDTFVKVKVKELIFGLNTDDYKKELLSKIAEQFCPGISVKNITRGELNTGEAMAYDL
ncbi:hypothetical protein BFP97_08220 [Roseivirga sp. 4D4]|uniref:DUF2971 domain-containing protein n=1 Tax=Roseivirga sp. 4D4 TaxID=1889784 RepID=UPI000853295D|nr:DUF2971 domain-containing protein [Roseivirga sp. 4D4]OEK01507.1 hypothetical protein BFP97_08220 [Roseivirga sp. 4D4]